VDDSQGGTAGCREGPLAAATLLALAAFGAAQAVLGTFFHAVGPAPLAAACFDAAILGTCLLGGWGLRRPLGALAPAAGWLACAFLLASGTSSGSVLIEASAAGSWFLFGGAACAAAGAVVALAAWPRRPPGRRA